MKLILEDTQLTKVVKTIAEAKKITKLPIGNIFPKELVLNESSIKLGNGVGMEENDLFESWYTKENSIT